MISDERLMTAYKLGEEDAFNALYSRYSAMVYGYARKRLNPSEVEDFYQSVWRHLHEKRELYAEFPIWVPGDFLKGDRPERLLAS